MWVKETATGIGLIGHTRSRSMHYHRTENSLSPTLCIDKVFGAFKVALLQVFRITGVVVVINGFELLDQVHEMFG